MNNMITFFRYCKKCKNLFRTIFYNWLFKSRMKEVSHNVDFQIYGDIRLGKNVRFDANSTIVVEKGGSLDVGDNAYIGANVMIRCYHGKVSIGNNVSINAFSFLNGAGGLFIGANTRIGSHTSIISSNHIFSDRNKLIKDQGTSKIGITIGENNWIGTNVTLLDGTITPDSTVIGASSLVTKPLESNGVFVGSPVKKIKEV
ncbi:acyltransferase [Thalassotalea nanhaiensis]|uniref:Acyltransferase n=1 Tax=Thalassotalea nanhaiensis TaxID=3065648 RepID=A0ABY9TPI8_9GAMM|nr:acyltransferase [Colwelliaceae bacterium SQ345]